MNKFEKMWWGGVSVAIIGILAFWGFGFAGNLQVAAYSFFVAGTSAWIALIGAGIGEVRKRNGCY